MMVRFSRLHSDEGRFGNGNIEYAMASGISPRSKAAIIPLTVSCTEADMANLLRL
jgi:hypothetical protein